MSNQEFNPYQAPAGAAAAPQVVYDIPVDVIKILKRFRREMHGLGGVWIFFGAVALIAVVGSAMQLNLNDLGRVILLLLGVIVSLWVNLGIFTCLKFMWAVWVGLVLSYLSLVGNAIRIVQALAAGGDAAICQVISLGFAVLILVAIIYQAHRCINMAGQLTAAGIPLTARPSDYELRF